VDDYVLARLTGRSSPATFWYLPEPARVHDAGSLQAYLEPRGRSPLYVIDYSRKLEYRLCNADGILELDYGPPLGRRVNPEAAFQYALALHDDDVARGGSSGRFLACADWFLTRQSPSGDWLYDFPWHELAAPWSSALAQARGASVMLRAFLLTGKQDYLLAARRSISRFSTPVEEGGYLRRLPQADCAYFEEYPGLGNAVKNGFMASLFGVYELMRWASDPEAERLWRLGTASLERMLPLYTHRGWTLYDLDPKSPGRNWNSPRYHRLVIDYLRVLSTLQESPVYRHHLELWRRADTPSLRARAVLEKLARKLRYR
jgi:hypothetical protein